MKIVRRHVPIEFKVSDDEIWENNTKTFPTSQKVSILFVLAGIGAAAVPKDALILFGQEIVPATTANLVPMQLGAQAQILKEKFKQVEAYIGC